MPPAGPFLSGQKGAKEPVKAGDSDFPRLNNPPLETAKKGELRFPLLGTSPKSFYRLLSGGGGLLRNAPAAPACMRGGWNVGAGLVPAPTDGMSRLFCILFNVKLQNSAQLPLFPGQSGFSGRAFFSH